MFKKVIHKKEISSGGVVVHLTKGEAYILLMKDMNGSWTFPKGKIEIGEKQIVAARREIREEVGVKNLRFLTTLPEISYSYKRNGSITKRVYYFLFTSGSLQPFKLQKEEGISAAVWKSLAEAIKLIGYPKTNRKILLSAKRFLEKTSRLEIKH
jgi:8-oxo-dGTP pyrophosphatase MutT (NUDIX family)